MKKHLLTAALAIVAIGAAVAGTVNSDFKSAEVRTQFTYYRTNAPVCSNPITCDTEIIGPTCASLGTLYKTTDCSVELAPQGSYQP
jgi:hypothetical protein